MSGAPVVLACAILPLPPQLLPLPPAERRLAPRRAFARVVDERPADMGINLSLYVVRYLNRSPSAVDALEFVFERFVDDETFASGACLLSKHCIHPESGYRLFRTGVGNGTSGSRNVTDEGTHLGTGV